MPFQFEAPQSKYVGTIADLMQAPGRAEAQAALAKGQVWGNVGQSIAQLPQQIQEQKAQQIAQQLREMQIGQMRQQQQQAAVHQAVSVTGKLAASSKTDDEFTAGIQQAVANGMLPKDAGDRIVQTITSGTATRQHYVDFADKFLDPIKGAPGTTFLGAASMQPTAAIPEKKPDYTVNGVRFSGTTNQPYGPATPKQETKPQPFTLGPGQTRYDADNNPVAWGEDRPAPKDNEIDLAKKAAAGDKTAIAALGFLKSARGGGEVTGNAKLDQDNAKITAQGIKDHKIPLSLLEGTRATSQGMMLMAELNKLGVDGDKELRNWMGTKTAIRSLNGAQQIRLTEAINKASASLDKVQTLNNEWAQIGARVGLKVLNRAELKAAQNGAYGAEAASVAQRLEAQIADVQGELANVIMGGNSPTDKGLELASHNLKSDWTQKVLSDSVEQVRYNLNLAQDARNEILGQLGVTSTQIKTPPPQGAGMIYAKDPNGVVHQAAAGTPLPAGWVLVEKKP